MRPLSVSRAALLAFGDLRKVHGLDPPGLLNSRMDSFLPTATDAASIGLLRLYVKIAIAGCLAPALSPPLALSGMGNYSYFPDCLN